MKEYLGKISKVIDPDLYTVEVTIPGLTLNNQGIPAIPYRGELDEPKIGDLVIVKELDPIYGSIMMYSKVKENNFIGIRSKGKLISIDEGKITIGTFKKDALYEDSEVPDLENLITITESGDIDIIGDGNLSIVAKGRILIDYGDYLDINGGGLGIVTMGGTASPSGTGCFCAIPVCPLTNAPHVGSIVTLV